MRTIQRNRRGPALAAATVLAVLLLVGACSDSSADDGVASLDDGTTDDSTGGGGDEADLSPEEQEEALLDWAQCMRDQGIDIPDPEVTEDGGVIIGGGTSGDPDDEDGTDDVATGPPFEQEDFEAAREECGDPPGGPSELSEEELAERQDAALEFAQCMRDEGVEDFPDPDLSQEGPGGPQTRTNGPDDEGDDADADDSADDSTSDGPMIAGPFGEVDLGDPETAAAFEACQDSLGDIAPPGGAVPAGPGGPDSAEDEG
jgi:hypothetical protein